MAAGGAGIEGGSGDGDVEGVEGVEEGTCADFDLFARAFNEGIWTGWFPFSSLYTRCQYKSSTIESTRTVNLRV